MKYYCDIKCAWTFSQHLEKSGEMEGIVKLDADTNNPFQNVVNQFQKNITYRDKTTQVQYFPNDPLLR